MESLPNTGEDPGAAITSNLELCTLCLTIIAKGPFRYAVPKAHLAGSWSVAPG